MRKKQSKKEPVTQQQPGDSTDSIISQSKRKLTAEDKYFAEQDKQLIKRKQIEKKKIEKEKKKQKTLLCPECGDKELARETIHEIPVAICPECEGLWMEKGIFQSVLRKEANILSKFFQMFQKK